MEYLRKIQDLCQEAGAELVLMGLPNRVFPMQMIYAWTRDLCEKSRALANELGIRYFDVAYDMDAGLDWMEDTYDNGTHLNMYGAEKVTRAIEQYLMGNFQLEANQDPIWDEMLKKYQDARTFAEFQSETDPITYLSELIQRKDRCTILIAASNEYTAGMTEELLTYFDQLGLQLIREGQWTDSYLAVIKNGVLEHEAVSPRTLNNYTTVCDDMPVSMVSAGFFDGAFASIVVDGREYTMNQLGLNIVVVDQETGIVLDSAAMNTGADTTVVTHVASREFFTAYEDAVLLAGNV